MTGSKASGAPGQGLRIRPARPADRAALLRLNTELLEAERRLRPGRRPGAEAAAEYVALTAHRVAGRDGVVLVAEDAEGIAGACVCTVDADMLETQPRELWVQDVIVARRARRRGVARALLAAAEAEARARGITRVLIGALTANRAATRAWRALGYTPQSTTYERFLEGS